MGWVRSLGAGAVFTLITLAFLEAALRIVPAAIPTSLLKRFEPGIRSGIAQRRGLPHEGQTYLVERSDGGPPLRVFKPNSRIRFEFEDTGERCELVMDASGFCNASGDNARARSPALVAIGDSFTACHPPEPAATWPSVLARRLGTRAHNLGRGGYGPYEYVQLLETFGVALEPSLVIMQIYEGNDLRDAVRHHRYLRADIEERERYSERASFRRYRFEPAPFLGNALGRRSYAYNLAVVAIARGSSSLAEAAIGDARERVNFRYRLRFPDAVVAMNVRNTDQDEVRSARELAAGRVSLDALDGALEAFAAAGRRRGFRAVISYAPSAHTAYAEFVEFEDPALARLMPQFSRAQRTHIRQRAEALGVEFVDLTPAFHEAARRERAARLLYFPINVHFTPTGHAVAAEAVARALGSASSAPTTEKTTPASEAR